MPKNALAWLAMRLFAPPTTESRIGVWLKPQ